MRDFLKQKIFIFIIIVLAIGIAIKSVIQSDNANTVIWLIIAILHILNLVREYRRFRR